VRLRAVRRPQRWKSLGLIVVVMLGAPHCTPQPPPSLTIAEEWSVPWPGSTRISRVVVEEERLVVQSGPWIYTLDKGDAPRLLGNFEILDIGGVGLTGEHLELVDRRTGRIVRTSLNGPSRSWYAIPLSGDERIVAGALTRCGWAIAVVDDPEGVGAGTEVLILNGAERQHRRVRLPFEAAEVNATGPLVVVSQSGAPYRVAWLRCDEAGVVMADNSRLLSAVDLESWRPLPAFFTAGQVVQTWVDAGSDRRRFASFGMDGRLLRWTDLEAPLTLVAADCTDTVIGLRSITELEVVGFRASRVDRPAASENVCSDAGHRRSLQ